MIGAKGFIGSHLYEKLMSETSHKVLALDVYHDKIKHLLELETLSWKRRIQFHRLNIKSDSRLEGLIKMAYLKAADALSKLEQCPKLEVTKGVQASKKREVSLKPLIDVVVYSGLLCHEDKDVKLGVAICITELLRVMAPEPPFEDRHLRDVFKLIIGLFADLADTSSPLFSKKVKVCGSIKVLRVSGGD